MLMDKRILSYAVDIKHSTKDLYDSIFLFEQNPIYLQHHNIRTKFNIKWKDELRNKEWRRETWFTLYIIKSQANDIGDGLGKSSCINPNGPSYVSLIDCCSFGTNWPLKFAWKTTK